jgi:hypothetical protein
MTPKRSGQSGGYFVPDLHIQNANPEISCRNVVIRGFVKHFVGILTGLGKATGGQGWAGATCRCSKASHFPSPSISFRIHRS